MKASVHSQKDVAATYDLVRLRVGSLVGPMCVKIEQAADQIIAGPSNAAVQRAALLWKTEGVPALRAARFQPDPYTALFDSWVLCYQMATISRPALARRRWESRVRSPWPPVAVWRNR